MGNHEGESPTAQREPPDRTAHAARAGFPLPAGAAPALPVVVRHLQERARELLPEYKITFDSRRKWRVSQLRF